MRFLIRFSIPTTQGNEMVRDPNFLKNIEDYIKSTNAESVLFYCLRRRQNSNFVIDVTPADQMPKVCEPLFMLGGKVHWNMVMTINDLKKGL
ncbi:MAG: hypothetical protein L0H53_13520 [Candidatus Nitrosocosmicus sp.]|nr:hypothetical protein [Candidatus Nitrosocosmicus sp.]MDN5868181.1 hypothetical protein [Candidatus Nitrosocosmicus sp.]